VSAFLAPPSLNHQAVLRLVTTVSRVEKKDRAGSKLSSRPVLSY
jgi:hypothetical protein